MARVGQLFAPRLAAAALAGAVFGLGLLLSGMTDTRAVQGFLDIFGAWDPTLAFVMGGAMIPMAVAWGWAKRHPRARLGGDIPTGATAGVTPALIIGSVLFGAGWALVGLCPGPALASLSWGGASGAGFLLAMAMGMLAARPFRARQFRQNPKGIRE